MAKAYVSGVACPVHVDRDLGESWAVSVIPPAKTPIVVKLQGNDREAVLKGGLEILQKSGRIERYEL